MTTMSRRVLYDPRHGGEAVTLVALDTTAPGPPMRSNYFSIYWIEAGAGTLWADDAEHPFSAGSLLFLVPYQRLRLMPAGRVRGTLLQFHANFLCVETFHAETGCSGILFNDTFGSPVVVLDRVARRDIRTLVAQIDREQRERHTGYAEAIVSHLKLLLIAATRLKTQALTVPAARQSPSRPAVRPPLLSALQELVETHYRTVHAPSQYAAMLHVTPKTLNRLVRAHLGRTVTDVIRARVLTHAKWELLHTLKPVKAVAAELGFDDELYFSRLFKKATGLAPTVFREFETAIRGGSNLSMPLARPAIPAPGSPRR